MSTSAPLWIDTEAQLERWAQRLVGVPWIAIDTESDSFHRYREKVCLIQMTALGEDVLIDPLAMGSLQALAPMLADPSSTKIFHDAGYDLICLQRDFGFVVRGLFDTMLASRLLGARHFGLAALLAERFEFAADKRHQRSDWARRPLSEGQLHYARYDTHFLPQLALQLQAELTAAGRDGWATEEFARLPDLAARAAPRTPVRDADAFWRITGARTLTPEGKGVLQQLVMARDRIAERLDRPPFKVCNDDVLLEIARQPPQSAEELQPRPGLRRHGVYRHGRELWEAISRATPIPGGPPKGSGKRRRSGRMLEPDARERYEALRVARRVAADAIGLEPEVAMSNALLEELALHPQQAHTAWQQRPELAGWRRQHLLGPLTAALADLARAPEGPSPPIADAADAVEPTSTPPLPEPAGP